MTAAALVFGAAVAGFPLFAWRAGSEGIALVAASAVFSLLFIPYPILSVRLWCEAATRWIVRAPRLRAAALAFLPVAVLGLYAAGTGEGDALRVFNFALYAAVPMSLLAGRDPFRAPARLALVLLLLWLPIEVGLFKGVALPAGGGASLDAARLLAMDVALILFVVAAPARDVGFTFALGIRDLRYAALALGASAVVLVPLGLGIGFLTSGWRRSDPVDWALNALSIYFLVSLPEEFLFRGLLQNALGKFWEGPRAEVGALVVASMIFGAAHLNNAPAPNFHYAALATLAGVAYGWVWLRTRKVTASALTHGAVDWIWLVALRG